MANYRIAFAQWYSYEVEAENEDEALELAEEEFATNMRSPIANVVPDETLVYEIDEDGEREIGHYC